MLAQGVKLASQHVVETFVGKLLSAATPAPLQKRLPTRAWDTRVGSVELKIPKITTGTYFPSLLE